MTGEKPEFGFTLSDKSGGDDLFKLVKNLDSSGWKESSTPNTNLEFQIVETDHPMTTEEVAKELEKRGMRLPTEEELKAFKSQTPKQEKVDRSSGWRWLVIKKD